MGWETIDNLKPAPQSKAVPPHGVSFRACTLRTKKRTSHFIKVGLGAELARKMRITGDEIKVRLLFGTEADAGKIKISVDAVGGNFPAKRLKSGAYGLTINGASAEGLFASEFPVHAISNVEALQPQNGQPPHCIVKASKEMLAVGD